MCFSVNLWNHLAIQRKLAPWAQKDFEKMPWEPRERVDGFTFPHLPVLLQDRTVQSYSWGLIPSWVRDEAQKKKLRSSTLNATCERFYHLPSFRQSSRTRRCLVPVWGFYEYKHSEGGKVKTPYLITLKNAEAFFLAGIWSVYQEEGTFSILTMPANALMREIHNSRERMPVIVNDSWVERWLEPGEEGDLVELFTPDDTLGLEAKRTDGQGELF